MLLLTLLVVASAAYWGAMVLLLLRVVRAVPVLSKLRTTPPAKWPRVSLIMPARNEERTLEAALRSKLEETYPDLELILVNDRSTDATGSIADTLARVEPRIQVVHVGLLPEGWLGKVHAMQRGYERASGEWVLFSDADIHLAPGVLEQVLAYAEQERCDHVCVLPEVTLLGFGRGPRYPPSSGGCVWAGASGGPGSSLLRGVWRGSVQPRCAARRLARTRGCRG